MPSDRAARLRRLQFRAWHRGTKEADLMIGGFVDRHLGSLDDADIAWVERLLEENDVDIMAWVLGTVPCPDAYRGPLFDAMQRLDYLTIAR